VPLTGVINYVFAFMFSMCAYASSNGVACSLCCMLYGACIFNTLNTMGTSLMSYGFADRLQHFILLNLYSLQVNKKTIQI